MPRKKWTAQTEITPALLKFREKRKWQINLRRYVIDRSPSPAYAPYFGLDIENLRKWFEIQFSEGMSWGDFATKWQFDHIIPVTYFDFKSEDELKLCWNFTNLRIEQFQLNKNRGNRMDVIAAKGYFQNLYDHTLYKPCLKLLEKIDRIELAMIATTQPQLDFLLQNRPYLDMIEGYSTFEFELLNSGRDLAEVRKEIDFLKNPRG
jgi:hypothetical protein